MGGGGKAWVGEVTEGAGAGAHERTAEGGGRFLFFRSIDGMERHMQSDPMVSDE